MDAASTTEYLGQVKKRNEAGVARFLASVVGIRQSVSGSVSNFAEECVPSSVKGTTSLCRLDKSPIVPLTF